MRNSIFLFVAALFVSCLFACVGKDPVKPSARLYGQWNLRQQKTELYIDGVKQTDTLIVASSNSSGQLFFKDNGTYTSGSLYTSGTGVGTIQAQSTTNGTYSFNGSELMLSSTIAGLFDGAAFSNTTGTVVITPISHSTRVDELTSSTLILHAEFVYTITLDGSTQSRKVEADYVYTK
jgi:hypothetical protein